MHTVQEARPTRPILRLKRTPPPEPTAPAVVAPEPLSERQIFLARLIADHPTLFNRSQPKPLAIGVGSQILAAYPEVSRRTMEKTLQKWTSARRYLLSVAREGAQRHALDGSVTEPVEESHRTHAKKRLPARRPR